MKKSALKKDFVMEIKKSANRFLSILFIVALGVAFFSGIQSAAPDMRYTADQYFDEHGLADLKIVSTLGLTGGKYRVNQADRRSCLRTSGLYDRCSVRRREHAKGNSY